MLNTNHPADERLSALASGDTDAVADAPLTTHVSACDRCAATVDELATLRANLASLPDLFPARQLRLVPEVTGGADRLGTWVRRVFGPAMAAGAALALVGMVGTAAPSFQAASPAGGTDTEAAVDHQRASAGQAPAAAEGEGLYGSPQTDGVTGSRDNAEEPGMLDFDPESSEEMAASRDLERSPWPMVLFTGVAILIGAALLRWIVVPRAG